MLNAMKCSVAVSAMVLFAGAAQAALVNDLIGPPVSTVVASDEARQDLVDRGGAADVLDVGDSLYGIAAVEQLFVTPDGGSVEAYSMLQSAGNAEWTAEFQLLVTAKAPVPGSPGVFDFTFGPDPAFDTAGAGTMVRLYEDDSISTFDLDGVGAPSVTDGTFYGALGIVGPGNGWVARGADLVTLATLPVDRLATGSFALDVTAETMAGDPLADLTLADLTNATGQTGEVVGTTNVGGPIPGSPWDLSANLNFQLQNVPEPASLALLGLGGFMMLSRRQR